MTDMFCDACGDIVKAAYPCKFIISVFHDRREIPFNICPDCMKTGELVIDLPRTNLRSIVLSRLGSKKWQKRVRNE